MRYEQLAHEMDMLLSFLEVTFANGHRADSSIELERQLEQISWS